MKYQTPEGLRIRGTEFWDKLSHTYEFNDAELYLLEQICREQDLIQSIQEDINLGYLRMTGFNGNDIADPLLTELRQHLTIITSLIKALKIPLDETEKAKISSRQRANANVRWSKRGAA
jgi:hypothetical protein